MNKNELRKLYKQKRMELSPNERENRSEMLCHALFSNFKLTDKIVSLYLPIEHLNEINTYKILEMGLSLNTKFAIPKVDDSGKKMLHYAFESIGQLELSEWKIPEPKAGKKIQTKDLQIVIVPLLAFDINGYRVGYGKGFYDELLSRCGPQCQFIGLSYFDEPVKIDDLHAADFPLDYCITPEKLYRFTKI